MNMSTLWGQISLRHAPARARSRFRPQKGLNLALLYVLGGKLATLIAVSPGYAAATFPPAGIALAFTLVYGRQALPWVFGGAVGLNVWLGLETPNPGLVSLAVVPAAIGLGSTLQAYLGSRILHPVLGNPVRMDRNQDAILFLLTAPLVAFVSATLSVTSLVLSGASPTGTFGMQWLVWWLGDTAGIGIFFPVTMAFLELPKELWRPRRITVVLPMVVAFCLSITVFISTRGWEDESVMHDFHLMSEHAADKLQQSFDSEEFLVEEVAAFMSHRTDSVISRTEFDRFATESLKRYPMIQAVEWAPQILNTDRPAFEARQQLELSEFHIREKTPDSKMVLAAERPDYYPVTYVKPLEGNRAALGYDLGSSADRRAAFVSAIQKNMAVATAPLTLVQETGKQSGILLLRPVNNGPNSPGLVLTVLRFGDFVDHSLGDERKGFDIRIVDKTSGTAIYPGPLDIEKRSTQKLSLRYGGREYLMLTAPSAFYLQSHQPWQSLALLAAGMLATTTLGVMLLLGTGAAARTERLVEERTDKLASESRKNSLFMRNSSDGIHILDSSGYVLEASDAFCRMLGYPREEVLGMNVRDWDAQMDRDELVIRLEQIMSSEDGEVFETRHRRKDGSIIDVEVTTAVIDLDGRKVQFASARDISERKINEERILQLAYYDTLTGLPNRRLFRDRLERAMAGGTRTHFWGAMMMLDLDHFKRINDTRGHDAGDKVLVEVSQRIRSSTREESTVCRFGGDEFLILIEDLDVDETAAATVAERFAERIRSTIALPILLPDTGEMHRITSSIGISLFRGHETAGDVLLKQADVALYQVKSEGRNGIRFFNQHMQSAIEIRTEMESALEQAIENGELHLYLQSQVNANGKLLGAEALLRWRHPKRGIISPTEFIPLAEESGLIVEIGQWVIDTACAQLATWAKDPRTRDLRIAVNISARQFRQVDFVERVRTSLMRSGAPAERLHMELTESVLIDSPEEMAKRMTRLHALGVQFALDDFGTGYSSLAYLKGLPFDQIKIDRSFVAGITDDANDAGIVQTILAMSHSLGLTPIAEGVETLDQRDYLMRYGCENFQGYLFGKPVPMELFLQETYGPHFKLI